MNEKLFKETFSRLRASDEAKKEVISIMEEHENKRKLRLSRPLSAAAICAALVAALTITAVAAGEYLGNWHQGDSEIFPDETMITDGKDVGFLVPDDTPEDNSDNLVNLPALIVGGSVKVNEEDRVILRLFAYHGTKTLADWDLDITDDLAASPDGTYSFYDEGSTYDEDTGSKAKWVFDITVVPGWESPEAEANGDGYGYLITGDRRAEYTRYFTEEEQAEMEYPVTSSSGTMVASDPEWRFSLGAWGNASEEVPQTWSRDN